MRPIHRLAIVGASVRAAARSSIRAGYEVVAADLFADADLRRLCAAERVRPYPDALAEWLAEAECDAWCYTGGLENFPALVDLMAKLRPLVGNCGAALRRCRSWQAVQGSARERGFGFPETRTSADGLPHDGTWLCKTYRGANGSGVWLLDGDEALIRAAREGAAFQRVARGWPAAAIYAIDSSHARLVGVTRQWIAEPATRARPWQYAGSVGPAPVNAPGLRQLETIGRALREDFNLCGLVGVDLIVDGETLWLVELNPRYTASVEVVERYSGSSCMAAHVAACLGEPAPDWPRHDSGSSDVQFGKAILYAARQVEISEAFARWAIDRAGVRFGDISVADVPDAGQVISQGHPVVSVFASGVGEQCEANLRARLAEAERVLYATNTQ